MLISCILCHRPKGPSPSPPLRYHPCPQGHRCTALGTARAQSNWSLKAAPFRLTLLPTWRERCPQTSKHNCRSSTPSPASCQAPSIPAVAPRGPPWLPGGPGSRSYAPHPPPPPGSCSTICRVPEPLLLGSPSSLELLEGRDCPPLLTQGPTEPRALHRQGPQPVLADMERMLQMFVFMFTLTWRTWPSKRSPFHR